MGQRADFALMLKAIWQKHKKAIIIRLMALLVIFAILIYSHLLKVMEYHFDDVGFVGDKSLNIALITDLHACYYGDNQKWLIDILKEQRPDVILLGGDIYDDKRPFDNADVLLSQLPAIAPTYYVDGNHENWLPQADYDKVMNAITGHGAHIIHGKSVPIPHTNIIIHGVSDPHGKAFDKDLNSVSTNLNPNDVNVLLTHRPEHIDEYRKHNFDVILSGHAHGGQWRVPFLVNGVFAPNQGFLPPYAGGLYEFDDDKGKSKFIVSRGLARESTKVPRIFNRPELVFITLSQS